jgi:hypothetical protein
VCVAIMVDDARHDIEFMEKFRKKLKDLEEWTMYGTYVLHCYDIPQEIFATYRDLYMGGPEFHPKRKKLKGYQKCKK